jgi:ABC-type glycerol-3-phosphate transport system permease component
MPTAPSVAARRLPPSIEAPAPVERGALPVFLSGSRAQTVPVALSLFVGDFARWNLVFAGIAITIAPILAFYLFAQKYLMRGFSAGVKG